MTKHLKHFKDRLLSFFMSESKVFATKVVHVARNPKKQEGCVNNGIFQSSTLIFNTYEDFIFADREYYHQKDINPRQKTYGRHGTSTIFDCEEAIASLYNADFTKMTSCGYSAILVALNTFCKSGVHILVSDGVYGPTRSLVEKTLKKYGVDVTFYHPSISGDDIEKLIRPNTKVIYMESPSSLTFEVQDVKSIVSVAKKHQIHTIIDNTFFTSYYMNLFEIGVDIVIESCTKYLSGHSDVMAGAVVFNREIAKMVCESAREIGANTTAMNAYYVLRGIRTLKVRLDAHKQAFDIVIDGIKNHKKIKRILHPSQSDIDGYNFYKEQCTGYTSLFSIVLDGVYSCDVMSKFFNRLQYFGMGYSWGGYESLIIPFPNDMQELRTMPFAGQGNTCIRVYVGLENTQDLIDDLIASLNLL